VQRVCSGNPLEKTRYVWCHSEKGSLAHIGSYHRKLDSTTIMVNYAKYRHTHIQGIDGQHGRYSEVDTRFV